MTYRERLPQLDGDLFLTDGGIETTLIFHEGLDLPLFAAFGLLADEAGTDALSRYFHEHAKLATELAPASCSRARPGAPTRAGPRSSATPTRSSTD